jgi:hypothetical protein
LRFREQPRTTREGTRPGFKNEHIKVIDKDSPNQEPITQLFTREELDENGEPDNNKYCAECGTKLYYLPQTQQYMCSYTRCDVRLIDTNPDTPLLTKTDQSMQPYMSQHYDPNNSESEPVFISYNPDKGDVTRNKGYKIVKKVGNREHIHVDGYPQSIGFNDLRDDPEEY